MTKQTEPKAGHTPKMYRPGELIGGTINDLLAEIKQLRKALTVIGHVDARIYDDYPGKDIEQWYIEQLKGVKAQAHAALKGETK